MVERCGVWCKDASYQGGAWWMVRAEVQHCLERQLCIWSERSCALSVWREKRTWVPGCMFFIYTPFLRNTPTGQTAHQIYMLNGSNDADSRKDVLFLALVDTAAHLGDQIPQKLQLWGRE